MAKALTRSKYKSKVSSEVGESVSVSQNNRGATKEYVNSVSSGKGFWIDWASGVANKKVVTPNDFDLAKLHAPDFNITAQKGRIQYIDVSAFWELFPSIAKGNVEISIESQPSSGEAEDSYGGRILYTSGTGSSDSIKYKLKAKLNGTNRTSNVGTINITLIGNESGVSPEIEIPDTKFVYDMISGQSETIVIRVDYGNQVGAIGLLFEMFGAPDAAYLYHGATLGSSTRWMPDSNSRDEVGGIGMLRYRRTSATPSYIDFKIVGNRSGTDWRVVPMPIDWNENDLYEAFDALGSTWGTTFKRGGDPITNRNRLTTRLDNQTNYSGNHEATVLRNLTYKDFLPGSGGNTLTINGPDTLTYPRGTSTTLIMDYTVTGGTSPYQYDWETASLPAGVIMTNTSSANPTIRVEPGSGAPVGNFILELYVTDADNANVYKRITLKIT